MNDLRVRRGWLAIVAGLVGCAACVAADPAPEAPRSISFSALSALQDLPEEFRPRVHAVLRKPVLRVHGPAEAFRCNPDTYHWLLDHPDRAVRAWLKLGAKCMMIDDRGNGRFGCKDRDGSDVHWDTVVNEQNRRVWYAEGMVKPSLLLPQVPVRAVFVLQMEEGQDKSGRRLLRHQGELILQIDSKAASLATRLMGASAPHMAEQYVGQIQTFFAALSWYLNEHPERTRMLFAD
jgi:hypothetical protein